MYSRRLTRRDSPFSGAMRRHSVRIVGVLFAAWSSAALVGCDDGGEPEVIVLRMANWGSPAVESSFMAMERAFFKTFEQRYAQSHGVRVRVQVEQIPGVGQYAPKLVMMHVAGCAPDVITLDASSAAVFVDNGVLLDLAPQIARDRTFDASLYFENTFDVARRGSAVYAVPLDFTPMVIYYNKRLFDEAGVAYPREGWTWDDFLATCKALTVHADGSSRPARYGFAFENEMPWWAPWFWTNGSDVLDPQGGRATGYLDSPAAVETVQFLADLVLKHHVAPTPAERNALGADPFLAEKAAMDLKGHWMLLDYRARELEVGVVGLPTRTGQSVTVFYESGLGISADSPRRELAWEFIKFMTSEEVQKRRVASGVAISAHRKVADFYAGDPVEDAFLAAVGSARPPWGARVERYPACEDFGREMMDDVLYRRVSVPDAVRETAKLMDAVLAQ